MKRIIIAAHDPNLVIGKDGKLPWRYKEDLAFFKKTTMGYPLLMGRIVFEELNEKPLPGREAVVLSRSREYDHVPSFKSIDDALDYLRSKETEKVFIIGGGDIYRQMMDKADEMIITEIHETHEGDTFFPEYRDKIGDTWREISRVDKDKLSFVKYERIT
jgi:dihydrofolate reductase